MSFPSELTAAVLTKCELWMTMSRGSSTVSGAGSSIPCPEAIRTQKQRTQTEALHPNALAEYADSVIRS